MAPLPLKITVAVLASQSCGEQAATLQEGGR